MREKYQHWIRKKVPIFAITALLAAVPIQAEAAGWIQDDRGRWYEREDGSYPADEWMELEGKWYHFDRSGYMQTGWYRDQNGNRFWLQADGVMMADAVYQLDGTIYVIDQNGYCTAQENYCGWVPDGENWWFRNENGSWPRDGWLEVEGDWYFFDHNGYIKTGWLEENGIRYLLDEDGRMIRDTTQVMDGILYHFAESGAVDQMVKAPVPITPEDQKTDLERTVDAMADQILARIITADMNDHQKATAIYRWVRGNLSYSASTGSIGDWPTAAYEGFRRRRGHCYTYYATSLALLSRAGIPSVEMIRSTDWDHWWNLVYVDGVWLHFDTTPRRAGGNFCLLTTAQLMAYSNTHGNSHVFDPSQYPATP